MYCSQTKLPISRLYVLFDDKLYQVEWSGFLRSRKRRSDENCVAFTRKIKKSAN